MANKFRCIECGDFHEGECDKYARLAFMMDCGLDALDEYLDLPPEPGSRRWMIARGEYPPDAYPSELKAHLTKRETDGGRVCPWCNNSGVIENNRYGSMPCPHCDNGALPKSTPAANANR